MFSAAGIFGSEFVFELISLSFEFLGDFSKLVRKRRAMRCRDLAQTPGALPEKLNLLA